MSQQEGQQKQQPIQVHMVGKDLGMNGHSFMFPKGSKVHIQKRVDDLKAKKVSIKVFTLITALLLKSSLMLKHFVICTTKINHSKGLIV